MGLQPSTLNKGELFEKIENKKVLQKNIMPSATNSGGIAKITSSFAASGSGQPGVIDWTIISVLNQV